MGGQSALGDDLARVLVLFRRGEDRREVKSPGDKVLKLEGGYSHGQYAQKTPKLGKK